MTEDDIQHNPNADTGMAGFKAYFSALGGELPIPEKLDGLVAIQADSDYVVLARARRSIADRGGATHRHRNPASDGRPPGGSSCSWLQSRYC
jgi:predicted SnoaL-like aldol condensation-catalyzing enzyme